jgi:glycosyltransferase involved in cell wall biosynthesis
MVKFMRVALITDKFDFGGGLEHIFQICHGLPNIQFGVFGKPGEAANKFSTLHNVEVFSGGYHQSYIRDFKPDLLHIHHLKPLLALRRAPYRKLFTVHGVHIRKFKFKGGMLSWVKMQARIALEKQLFQCLDAIIAVSQADQELLSQAHGLKDSILVYNGVDIEAIRTHKFHKSSLRLELGLNPIHRIFLTVARFDYPKGHDILLPAIAQLAKETDLSGTTFVLVGGGELLPGMQALAKSLGISDHILFTGARPDAVRFMQVADAFILPSRYEGLPLTLLEALACQLPIVASLTSGITELADKFPNAIALFKNGDSQDLKNKILSLRPWQNDGDIMRFDTQAMSVQLKAIYDRFA